MSLTIKRLSKELPTLHKDLPPGISLASADGFDEWFMDIRVLDANPLYTNQTYRLKFKFPQDRDTNYPWRTFLKILHSAES